MSSQADPVPVPASAPDVPTKKYEDMTSEERAEYDRIQRKREEEEQAMGNHHSRIAGCSPL